MKPFILDAALVVRWLLESTLKPDINYANEVLNSLRQRPAIVPATWHIELANLLLQAERKRLIETHDSKRFLAQIGNLPISVDLESHDEVIQSNLQLARDQQVSNFEAAYLGLSLRTGYPIATTQTDLLQQMHACKIARYCA